MKERKKGGRKKALMKTRNFTRREMAAEETLNVYKKLYIRAQ